MVKKIKPWLAGELTGWKTPEILWIIFCVVATVSLALSLKDTVIGIIAAVMIYVLALLFSKTIVRDDVKMLPKGEKICKVLEKYDLIG